MFVYSDKYFSRHYEKCWFHVNNPRHFDILASIEAKKQIYLARYWRKNSIKFRFISDSSTNMSIALPVGREINI